jgi:predicted DNA-binding protein (MmcQ/YjbR family)
MGLNQETPTRAPGTANGENGRVSIQELATRIRDLALSFPRSYEDAPWGFPVFKVGDNRMFAWMIEEADAVHVTLKLTAEEREVTAYLPWVRPASHVGRYGWVTAAVTDEETLDAALEWLRESYWLKAPADVRDAALR